jgi:hypothetical protein
MSAHRIPPDWIIEAGLQDFKPARKGFRCDQEHELVALADIEPPKRNLGVTLDQNGFGRDRMMKILLGIRDNNSIPPIDIERADPGQRQFRLRAGFHRYYASVATGFTHVPAQLVPRLD